MMNFYKKKKLIKKMLNLTMRKIMKKLMKNSNELKLKAHEP